jgi:hypothetical protein
MRNRRRSLAVSALATASLLILAPARASAQKAASAAAMPCSTVLTAEEVKAAVGVALEKLDPVDRGGGETECDWMGRTGGLKTVAVVFYDQAAIKASSEAPTGDAFFDMIVKASEDSLTLKREVIPGVALHAAFVPAAPQTLAVVHRADGVARIVGNGLSKAQTIAIAKAVATP